MDHERVKGLDSVRGIAALIVLTCHVFRIAFQEKNPLAFQFEINFSPLEYLINGHLAVMIFFALSGFVLCYTVQTKAAPFSYKTYLIRRVTRIYIPYLIVMIASWALFDCFAGSAHGIHFSWYDWAPPKTPEAMVGMLLMGGFVGDNFLDGVTWTLFIEMQISLVFPALVFVMKRYNLWALAGCIGLSLLSSKLYVIVDGNSQFTLAHTLLGRLFLTLYYLQYFAVGTFIFLHQTKIQAWVQKIPLHMHLTVVATLLLLPFKLYGGHFLIAGIVYLITAGAIIIYSISFVKVSEALALEPFQWLGKVSYSLYLVHPPVIFTLFALLYHLVSIDVVVLIALPVIFVTAELTHRFVEIPSIAFGRKLAVSSRSSAIQTF